MKLGRLSLCSYPCALVRLLPWVGSRSRLGTTWDPFLIRTRDGGT